LINIAKYEIKEAFDLELLLSERLKIPSALEIKFSELLMMILAYGMLSPVACQ
jgi:hypothetical protein